MKPLIWTLFAVTALFWTGGAWALASLTAWAAQWLAAGAAADLGGVVAQWPVPAWLGLWVDLAWVSAAQDAMVAMLSAARSAWPQIGSAVGWLAPAVWVLWGLGLLAMLLLAAGVHLLVGRTSKQPAV